MMNTTELVEKLIEIAIEYSWKSLLRFPK